MESTNWMCRWARRRLPLLAGGELAVEERRRVERHLIGCACCREARDAAGHALAVLRGAGAVAPAGSRRESGGDPPSVWPALARQIRESRHRPAPAARWAWRPAGLRLVAAAGLIGVGLALGQGWVRWPATHPTPAVAAVPLPAPAEPVAPAPVLESMYAINDRDLPRAYDLLDREAIGPDRQAMPRTVADVAAGRPDPFRPPLSLRFDYDLEWVTAPASAAPAMRQSY